MCLLGPPVSSYFGSTHYIGHIPLDVYASADEEGEDELGGMVKQSLRIQ